MHKDLTEKNTADDKLARLSGRLDFSKEDLIPDQVMNEIIWKFVKGENVPMPAPVRAAFFKASRNENDD
jgi:hypothetical protein